MIRFPCPCRQHTFELPDEEGGGLVQCPKCGRLNDVPTLDELARLEPDGTLRLETPKKPNPKLSLREVATAFGASHTDEQGRPIDLRQSVDDLRRVGADEYDIAPSAGVTPVRDKPRYDPVTGELIRPLDIAPSPQARASTSAVPGAPLGSMPTAGVSPADDARVRRREAMSYERAAEELLPPPSVASLPIRLLEPINLMVMFFVGVILLVLGLFSAPLLGGLFFAAPVPLVALILLLSHYANCLEDLGPGQQDELPRPLRSAEFLADLWKPFVRFVVAALLAFAPAMAVLVYTDGPVRFVGGGVLFVAGCLVFPALLLTTCVSQHLGNLNPLRVLGTIGVLGPSYLAVVVVTLLAVVSHVTAAICVIEAIIHLFGSAQLPLRVALALAMASTFMSVYLGHLAAWHLALLYRRREGHFPWIYDQLERQRQEHKRLKVLAELEKTRAQARKTRSA